MAEKQRELQYGTDFCHLGKNRAASIALAKSCS